MNNKTSKNNWHYGMVIISFAIGIYIASTTILILTGLLLWEAAIISGVVVYAALLLREFSVIAGRGFLGIEPCTSLLRVQISTRPTQYHPKQN